jgi:hypothetical protein
VADFIAYAGANRGRITYASGGHGSSPHLCGELFKRMTGIEMTHVPYRTGAQQDLIAGHVDVMFAVARFDLPASRPRPWTCRHFGKAGRRSARPADHHGSWRAGL